MHWHDAATMFPDAYAACSLLVLIPPQTALRHCRLDSGCVGDALC
jgi:hypothetical protein